MDQSSANKKYLVISRGQWNESASRQEVQDAIDRFYVWYERNLQLGRMEPGSRLKREGTLVTRSAVTDGPFAEAKELVGGFWFIVASSLQEAAALAHENPCLAYGLSLEIRELEEARALATEVTTETPLGWRSR
jgi:hypothetical protein